jgi:hypothetical protein
VSERARAALAGAAAATVWGLLEPVDKRLFRFPYSDVALLGKAVTRGPAWRPLGVAMHAANGAVAGVAFAAVQRRVGGDRRRNALAFAAIENAALFPLSVLTDRYHPARGDPDLPPLARSPRAFGQATFRHLLFGLLLGVWSGPREPASERGVRGRDDAVS